MYPWIRLPDMIPLISFHSEAKTAPDILATMTHIAHTEIPWLPLPTLGREESDYVMQRGRRLPIIILVSTAMVVLALHFQLRYGEKSDGLVICRDVQVPGSVVVTLSKKLDHSFMVYSWSKIDVDEVDAPEMCEALLTMLVEIGEAKQEAKGKMEFGNVNQISNQINPDF